MSKSIVDVIGVQPAAHPCTALLWNVGQVCSYDTPRLTVPPLAMALAQKPSGSCCSCLRSSSQTQKTLAPATFQVWQQQRHTFFLLSTGGLGQLPSMSGASFNSHSDEVASLHSKMDQLIAAYALASTPRGTYIPDSIFAPTPDTTPQVVDTSPTSAASIAPKHRLSAPGSPGAVSSEEDAAQGRATAGPAFSLAPGKAVPGSALRLAPLQIPNAALSAVHAIPTKVRFSFAAPAGSPGNDSTQDDESQGSTANNADAVSEETDLALQSRDASLHPVLSSSSGTKAVSADAAAGTNSADQQALPLPGASAKPRRSFKQFLKRALH